MRFHFNIFNSWKDEGWPKWRVIHWFGLTTVFEPLDEFNPLLELHIWILNFDFRFMILKRKQKDAV